MSEEDHLLLPSIQKLIKVHLLPQVFVFEKCEHVVNVEQPLVLKLK